ncbi:MAG: transglycosylase SLT domain-containing protein [Bacteroidaceae bacterium]|nr:transglycosylase SLT domain-containing protein [Bacteroidaceae bacterium]
MMSVLYHRYRTFIILVILIVIIGCKQEKPRELGVFRTPNATESLDLDGIQANGELIILTLYGAQSYFEFYGEGYGTLFKLADAYAGSIGCTVRVDVMRSEAELMQHLRAGDGDIVTYGMPVSDSLQHEFLFCGQHELTHFVDSLKPITWLVRKDTPLLAQSVNQWMADHQHEFQSLTALRVTDSSGRVYTPRRHAYSPILNRAKGQISYYDHLFRKYSTQCNWDWHLLAAQAYQESAFDPNAVSYMGALGLMQLMPKTAQSMGVSISDAFNPENNLRGAVRLINKLNDHYRDISDPHERIKFILAAYNAGSGHIDDARSLARKYGKNPDLWNGNVDQWVLHLSEARYFNDEVVRCGYMRGTETYHYVYNIMDRWNEYKKMK